VTVPERVSAPPFLADDARRFRDSGAAPVRPRLAATVVLLRPGARGVEVFLQRRAATMAFAPSMYAFPGGVVDARDTEGEVGWVGPGPGAWAGALALPEADARGVVCAAVREVFEECGVLLAGHLGPGGPLGPGGLLGDVSGDDWEAARRMLLAREVALVELFAARGLAVRADLLVPYARWLTPGFEPRRYDTYFFLAPLPPDQRTREVGGESEHGRWLSVAEATASLPMLPPTAHTLNRLAGCDSVEAALAGAAGADVTRPVEPRLEEDADGVWLTLD
jgi:8-oxo-dGTP pyrophosphatase MutT (NUDIX family)